MSKTTDAEDIFTVVIRHERPWSEEEIVLLTNLSIISPDTKSMDRRLAIHGRFDASEIARAVGHSHFARTLTYYSELPFRVRKISNS